MLGHRFVFRLADRDALFSFQARNAFEKALFDFRRFDRALQVPLGAIPDADVEVDGVAAFLVGGGDDHAAVGAGARDSFEPFKDLAWRKRRGFYFIPFAPREHAGALFETFVATELERQASWFPEALSFWHYRAGEREVDVVVERPSGEIVGIEVKAASGGATRRADR